MNKAPWCDFQQIESIATSQFRCGKRSIHGPFHWRRVEQNAVQISRRSNANVMVVRLFAWFHDSQRINDSNDPGHGQRGAEFAASLRGKWYVLPQPDYERLIYACTWHTDKHHTADPTIATCWDADRLDLGRVGIIPSSRFMNTEFGRQVADAGGFDEFEGQ